MFVVIEQRNRTVVPATSISSTVSLRNASAMHAAVALAEPF